MNTIKTNERIFQVENFEGDIILCNLDKLSIDKDGSLMVEMIIKHPVKRIKHYWNNKLKSLSKLDVKEMINQK